MNEKHLSDDQLQDYLDGNITITNSFKAHLESCSRCQEALAAYQSLYAMLKEAPKAFLSESFADRTLAQLPDSTSRRFVLDRILPVIFVSITVITAFYFLALSGWLTEVPIGRSLFDVAGFHISTLSHSSTAALSFDPLLLIFVTITLASVGLIDHLIAKRRHRQNIISLV